MSADESSNPVNKVNGEKKPNPEAVAFFEKFSRDSWRGPIVPPHGKSVAEMVQEVRDAYDQFIAESAAPSDPAPGTEKRLHDLSDPDIGFLVAILDKTLQLEPELCCPLKVDTAGWRATLDAVFGGSFASADAAKAHGIALGTYKGSVSKEVFAPYLAAWRRASAWGDKERRFILQPISTAHYVVDLKESGCSLHDNYPPKLMNRWVEAVKTAVEQVREQKAA